MPMVGILFIKIVVYNSSVLVYDSGEQSRRPRVKCCQNGELFGGRRALPAMGYPHPLPYRVILYQLPVP